MTSVLFAMLIQGLLTALMITTRDKKAFLSFYVIVLCVDFLYELWLYNYSGGSTAYLELIPGSLRVLKGPLLFLFTQELLERPVAKKYYFLLFMPFAFCFLVNILALQNLLVDGKLSASLLVVNAFIFKYYYYYWVGFIYLSLFQLNRYYKEGDTLYGAVKLFLSYLAVSIVTYVTAYKLGVDKDLLRNIYNYLFFVQFALLIHISWRNKTTIVQQTMAVPAVPKERYQHSNLQESDLQQIASAIRSSLDQHRDYIAEEYTLQHLANAIGYPKHQVSQVITETLQSTFYELINTYRLELFLQKLKQDPSLSVSDLSYQVGFKSRTTLYKYFKSKLGLTPSEYKGQLKRSLDLTSTF